MPEFGGGRPPKLSKDMETKLINRIESENDITMVQVQSILKNEYDVDFTLPHVCNIVRKLGFEYIQTNDDQNTTRKVLIKTKIIFFL